MCVCVCVLMCEHVEKVNTLSSETYMCPSMCPYMRPHVSLYCHTCVLMCKHVESYCIVERERERERERESSETYTFSYMCS